MFDSVIKPEAHDLLVEDECAEINEDLSGSQSDISSLFGSDMSFGEYDSDDVGGRGPTEIETEFNEDDFRSNALFITDESSNDEDFDPVRVAEEKADLVRILRKFDEELNRVTARRRLLAKYRQAGVEPPASPSASSESQGGSGGGGGENSST